MFQRLKEWRDAQAHSEEIEPAMVFSTQGLRQLVLACSADRRSVLGGWPKTLEDLARLPFLKQWQVKRYGEDLFKIIKVSR
jgi:hypothetical protein